MQPRSGGRLDESGWAGTRGKLRHATAAASIAQPSSLTTDKLRAARSRRSSTKLCSRRSCSLFTLKLDPDNLNTIPSAFQPPKTPVSSSSDSAPNPTPSTKSLNTNVPLQHPCRPSRSEPAELVPHSPRNSSPASMVGTMIVTSSQAT